VVSVTETPSPHPPAHPAGSDEERTGPGTHGAAPAGEPTDADSAPAAAPLPETPVRPAVTGEVGRVELFDDGGLDWQRVSPRLVTTRTITLLAWLVPMVLVLGVGALALSRWLWVPTVVLLVVLVWGLWLIRRQVSAMSYIELAEDLVIRKGRVFRQVSSVPFGRLQYVDLQSGPLERSFELATLQIFTASPSSSATIPGLPRATAEQMRERLMQRGEAQRAGL
jgi:uncharacterized protein